MSVIPQNKKVRVHIFVSGRVQNVFFRYYTKKMAEKIGVFGWVKNLPDRRVEAVFEGEKEKVEKILEWSKKGPLLAEVKEVEINWEKYQGEFNSFEIKY